jgi:hypothetical protein
MSAGLSTTRIINANVNLSAPPSSVPNFNTFLILGTSTIIDTATRMRAYSTLAEIATDFGTSAEEYLAATLWFDQLPQPSQALVGRWCKTAAHGQLIGATLPAASQLAAAWDSISNGSLRITIDGGTVQNLSGLDFTGLSTSFNMNGVASVISAALVSIGAAAVWNAVYQRFELTSASPGAGSAVSFASATGSGTDISALAGLAVASSGAYAAGGTAAESALNTVINFDNQFSSQWYGLVIPSAADADHEAVAGYVEGATNRHFYGVNTQESAVLVSGDTTSVPYALQQLRYNRTATQYSSSSAYAVASLLGRILPTNWNNNNSAITLFGKTEPGVAAENLTTNQVVALEAKNCNVFVAYNNGTAIIEPGKCASGQFIDTIVGLDWLVASIQTNVFNLIVGSATKIPESDSGMHQIGTAIEAGLQAAVYNGLCAPGPWSGAGFGQIKPDDYLNKGYYLYIPPISSISDAVRAGRDSVPFQAAVRMAGAVHSASVTLNIGF